MLETQQFFLCVCVFKWRGVTWAQKCIASKSWPWVKIPISAVFLHECGQVVEHTQQYFPDLGTCGLCLLTEPQNRKCTELFIYDFDQRQP